MSAIDRLIEITEELHELHELLAASEPDIVQSIQDLTKERGSLIDSAKAELRDRGIGNHVISGYMIKVASGGKKTTYDAESVYAMAEELGHLDLLNKYNVFTRTVSADQLARLPEEIRVLYRELGDTVEQSARVSLPKELQ